MRKLNEFRRNHPPPIEKMLTKYTGRGISILVIFILFAVLIHTVTAKSIPGADFYTFWVAGRALFLDGIDPYSQVVTEQAQMGKLGRLAPPDEDQMAFAYPPYGLIAVLPTIPMSFDWAISFWLAFNTLVYLTMCFLVLPPSVRSFSTVSLLLFPIFLNLILGTFDILLSLGIFLFFGFITMRQQRSLPLQIAAGILLAWGTMKPQFIWLVLLFAVLYAIRERLLVFLVSFAGSMVVFLGLSFYWVPEWLTKWIARVQEYALYVQGQPTLTELLRVFMPAQPGLVLTGIAFVLCVLFTVYLLCLWWKGHLHWFKVLAWMAMMTYLFHLHGISYEQIIFFIPMILWLGLKGTWRSKEVLVFWTGAVVISWLAFATGTNIVALDRAPVLFNAVWVAWLLSRPGMQI